MSAAKRAHGEAEAERRLRQGMELLGLKVEGLTERRKGAAEKQVLAWWLRGRTTLDRRWVSERLGMGEESGVSSAVRWVKAGRGGELKRLQERLLAGASGASQQ